MVKRSESKETKADIANKLMADLDGMYLAGATAAGVAGFYGISGPLTKILMSVNGPVTIGTDPLKDPIGYMVWSYPPLGVIRAMNMILGGQSPPKPEELTEQQISDAQRQAYYEAIARAMSNIVEFTLLFKLTENEPLIRQGVGAIKDLAVAQIRATGEAVPF